MKMYSYLELRGNLCLLFVSNESFLFELGIIFWNEEFLEFTKDLFNLLGLWFCARKLGSFKSVEFL